MFEGKTVWNKTFLFHNYNHKDYLLIETHKEYYHSFLDYINYWSWIKWVYNLISYEDQFFFPDKY